MVSAVGEVCSLMWQTEKSIWYKEARRRAEARYDSANLIRIRETNPPKLSGTMMHRSPEKKTDFQKLGERKILWKVVDLVDVTTA